MMLVPYLAQTTLGGCGACSFIMVAKFFDPALTLNEEEVLQRFGVDGYGPRCFALALSFYKAAVAVGLVARVATTSREALRTHLEAGPVILYHKASGAPDALPHFSVAVAATEAQITRHDPGAGAEVIDTWGQFENLWSEAKVPWWPYDGHYTAVLRPKL
ncbi:MAG: hypothetical protein B7Y02_03315 [Rhodobacterales bacterium 17-64-5]|nr:MAG: hypothetical protein B7Y02_03315 [Rhodobacterales bacterium 17-64-5]